MTLKFQSILSLSILIDYILVKEKVRMLARVDEGTTYALQNQWAQLKSSTNTGWSRPRLFLVQIDLGMHLNNLLILLLSEFSFFLLSLYFQIYALYSKKASHTRCMKNTRSALLPEIFSLYDFLRWMTFSLSRSPREATNFHLEATYWTDP